MRAVATLVPGLHGHPLAAAGDQFAVVPDLGREVAVGPAVQLTGAVAEHALQAGIGLQDDAPGRKAADTDRRALPSASRRGSRGWPAAASAASRRPWAQACQARAVLATGRSSAPMPSCADSCWSRLRLSLTWPEPVT